MAEYLGYKEPNTVTLWILGGAAQISLPKNIRPLHELLISLAGPGSNLLLAGILLGINFFTGTLFSAKSYLPLIFNGLFWYNMIMCVFNMIPAFPMDGGRVFRSLLAMFMTRLTATKVATYATWGFATIGIIVGIYYYYFWIIAISLFIALASYFELQLAMGKLSPL